MALRMEPILLIFWSGISLTLKIWPAHNLLDLLKIAEKMICKFCRILVRLSKSGIIAALIYRIRATTTSLMATSNFSRQISTSWIAILSHFFRLLQINKMAQISTNSRIIQIWIRCNLTDFREIWLELTVLQIIHNWIMKFITVLIQ